MTAIPLKREFRFAHEPLRPDEAHWFVGRKPELDAFVQRLLFSNGGSYLVTGYRGVGKTSFVNHVVARLDQALRTARSVLGETRLVHVQLNLARALEPNELMHHVIRRLYETLEDTELLASLPSAVVRDLSLAYLRTSVNMTRKFGTSAERSMALPEWEVGLGPVKVAAKSPLTRKYGLTRSEEASFLVYDDRAAEHDLVRVARRLSSGYEPRTGRIRQVLERLFRAKASHRKLKILFVFDELDKLEDAELTDGAGKPSIDVLLNTLKTLFTTSGISFVFVAGKDLQERWLEDVGRGDSVYESVFSYDKYLPCMWADVDALCDQHVDWAAVVPEHLVQTQMVFADFKKYLAYVGRGIPRRVIRGFNELVCWATDTPMVVLDRRIQRRVAFYARLEELLENNEERLFGAVHEEARGTYLDKRRLSVYYLIDWILRRGTTAFGFADVLQASGQLSRRIAPAEEVAPQIIADLMDLLLANEYLEDVSGGAERTIVEAVGSGSDRRLRVPQRRLAEMGARSAPLDEDVALLSGPPGASLATIGRYRLTEAFAQGGTGTVYRAIDTLTGAAVAVKVLDRRLSSEISWARFQREAQVLARLHHPRIVRLLEAGEADGQLFIAMNFIDGADLSRVLAAHGRLDLPIAIRIATSMADAIAYVHGQGLARLDVKPSNVLLGRDGLVYVTDLGLVKPVTDRALVSVTLEGVFVGTPAYVAPEQARGETVDRRADVYSFGVVVYEMLAGRRPIEGASPTDLLLAQVVQRPQPLRELVDAPAELEHLVMSCLAKQASDRPQSMDTVLNALTELQALVPTDEARQLMRALVDGISHAEARDRSDTIVGTIAPVFISHRPVDTALEHVPVAHAVIRVEAGPSHIGQTFVIDRSVTRIGRSPSNDIVLDDTKVSRSHAHIARDDADVYTLEDQGALNQTLLNGEAVRGLQQLKDGDRIQIGDYTLVFMSA